jgi:hypothetical protein
MAIRRPGINSPTWLYQDFLFSEESDRQYRYVQVKWDGKIYERVSQSFDYSDPPFVGPEQRGGSVVAQIDYILQDKLVTITDWEVNWQDEWPLRLAVNYLSQCLYAPYYGYVLRVSQNEVYSQNGEPIGAPTKDAYAFWVSERFNPITNIPGDYLYY